MRQVNDLSHKNKSDKSDISETDKSSNYSSISANSVPDKEILLDLDDANDLDISNPAQKSSYNKDKKMVHFEMIFRDTGVGISPEN